MKDRLKETLSSSQTGDRNDQTYKNVPPIADLFPSTTIMVRKQLNFGPVLHCFENFSVD